MSEALYKTAASAGATPGAAPSANGPTDGPSATTPEDDAIDAEFEVKK
jgi:hypothetical protein